jgi:hypothetical protein
MVCEKVLRWQHVLMVGRRSSAAENPTLRHSIINL